jgi:hypothetical protein
MRRLFLRADNDGITAMSQTNATGHQQRRPRRAARMALAMERLTSCPTLESILIVEFEKESVRDE